MTGFAVIDPGGNWIRFTAGAEDAPAGPGPGGGGLAGALRHAVVMGDSRGDHERAARLPDHALRRGEATAAPPNWWRHWPTAPNSRPVPKTPRRREFLARVERVTLDEAGRRVSADALTALRDLAASFSARPARLRPAD
ncbi:hypothetical protein ACFQVA_37400 [Actinomadura keratinilytica]